MKQANATFVATVKDIVGNIPLPPGVKLPELKLPPLNVSYLCGTSGLITTWVLITTRGSRVKPLTQHCT